MGRDFTCLKKRIRRKYGKFEYVKVETNEGFGVLHILYRGSYIPHRWLSENWEDIYKSKIVDIRLMRNGGKRLAGYLVGQYVSGQEFVRMSWSWFWVFPKFVGVWKTLLKSYNADKGDFAYVVESWKIIIYKSCYIQTRLFPLPESKRWIEI